MNRQTRVPTGTTSRVIATTIALLASLLTMTTIPAAAADANTCSYVRDLDTGAVSVSWRIDDLKRVSVRSNDGWIATLDAPVTSLELRFGEPRDRTYSVVVTGNNGPRGTFTCSETVVMPDTTCTWTSINVSTIRVDWDLDNVKRVNVRNGDGWLATVDGATASVIVSPDAQNDDAYILAKFQDGNSRRVDCTKSRDEPRFLGFSYAPTNGPVCATNDRFGHLSTFNAHGTQNLRDSNGWVQSLLAGEVVQTEAGESHTVVIRNPISGTETIDCENQTIQAAVGTWGGSKASLTPDLAAEQDDFVIVKYPGTADFEGELLVNKNTGDALTFWTNDEWAVEGVNIDGTILFLDDNNGGDYEVHLSPDRSTFTYYEIG